MKTSVLFKNLLITAMFAVLLAGLFDASVFVVFPLLVAAGAVQYWLNAKFGYSLFEGLAPEVWLPDLMTNPFPDSSFMSAARDMTEFVDNDKINGAEIGLAPDVLVNNTTYPIPQTDANDTPFDLTLSTYDTTSTVIRNAVAVELKYNQRQAYINLHKEALAAAIGIDAAWYYAPAGQDLTKFNKIVSLGANDSVIDGIIDLQTAYGQFKKTVGLNLVLDPVHLGMISKEDKVLYKEILAKPGTVYYGFRIWQYTDNPFYKVSDNTKAAKGTAFLEGIHKRSSFAFVSSEVMAATGSAKMFSQLDAPQAKGDIINFQVRALALPIRNKYQSALLK